MNSLLDEKDIAIQRLNQKVERYEKDNASLVDKNVFLHDQLQQSRNAYRDLQAKFDKLEQLYKQTLDIGGRSED